MLLLFGSAGVAVGVPDVLGSVTLSFDGYQSASGSATAYFSSDSSLDEHYTATSSVE